MRVIDDIIGVEVLQVEGGPDSRPAPPGGGGGGEGGGGGACSAVLGESSEVATAVPVWRPSRCP